MKREGVADWPIAGFQPAGHPNPTLPPEKLGRMQDGRFRKGVSGNPRGKAPGTRNRATVAAMELLDGQAERLTAKAIELALAGDGVALRLCLERLIPVRREPVDLNIQQAAISVDLREMATNEISAIEHLLVRLLTDAEA